MQTHWEPASAPGLRAERPALEATQPRGPGEDLERELRRTQAQLVEACAEITALRRQKGDLRPALARVLKKTGEELRAYRYCAVQPAEDTCEWEAVTERCCLGGCDMGVYTFSAEREALLFSALLEAIGYRPDHNTACSSCYAEYRKDRIETT